MSDVLNELYIAVYDKDFNYEVFDNRINMQKMVYLLENMAVHVDDYSFIWANYGPYSLALDFDARRCYIDRLRSNITFTDYAKKTICILKGILNNRGRYNETQWMESISSLHYLKYILKVAQDDKEIVDDLMKRKPKLKNREDNERALKYATMIEDLTIFDE